MRDGTPKMCYKLAMNYLRESRGNGGGCGSIKIATI